MGYYSTIRDIDVDDIVFDIPVPVNDWNTMVEPVRNDQDAWDNLAYLMGLHAATDKTKELGKESEEFVLSIGFDDWGAQSGKTYYLEENITALQNMLLSKFGRCFTGTFIVEGEEYGDIVKYVLNDDGSITERKARIVFD